MSSDLRSAIDRTLRRIASAASRSGGDPDAITLLAATKNVAIADIRLALDSGITTVGENRVQELLEKQQALPDVEWHLIGPLQRNKVNKVVGRVSLIHTVDSVELAGAIGRRAVSLGISQDVLVEVNTSGEPTKHGFSPDDATQAAIQIADIPGIRLRGAMTMAAPGDPSAARVCFAGLARLVATDEWPAGAVTLSMGMSDDFEDAIEEGATIVRVGSAIFGARCDLGLGA